MTFIRTIPPEEATGTLAQLYDGDLKSGDAVEGLRRHGFSDAEILDIVLAAAARNFYSRVVDALGAEPDPEYLNLEAGLRTALAVGRPFGDPAG